ncbi:unnamed protein product [Chrysoparadoxa australica]
MLSRCLITEGCALLAVLLQVAAQDGTVTQVSAGTDSTCALFQGGNVKCWGNSQSGRLGYGNLEVIGDDEMAGAGGFVNLGVTEDVPVLPLKAAAVHVGGGHACALITDPAKGNVKCWGYGDVGALGYGNKEDVGDDKTPADVGFVDVGGTVTQLALGRDHTCALLADKKVVCWGFGENGRLGYGSEENLGDDPGETPASIGPVSLNGKPVASIAAGGAHTCVIFLDDGTVRCWGRGAEGQLGNGAVADIGDDELPLSGVVDLGGTRAVDVSAGFNHTCAVVQGGAVYCWGSGQYGQLGLGNTNTVGTAPGLTPGQVGPINLGQGAISVHAGYRHTCVVLADLSVKCFGEAEFGQIGLGSTASVGLSPATLPAAVQPVSLGGTVTQVSSGGYHNCALKTDGGLTCWGYGARGRLGLGNELTIGDNEEPDALTLVLAECGGGDCANGTCAENACSCTPGFEGVYCEDNIDACVNNPCANSGICTDGLALGAYTCNCEGTGFDGIQCEDNLDACVNNPCANGGICTDGLALGAYTCNCEGTGFEGTQCKDNVDECMSNPCANGGICIDGVALGAFTCNCEGSGFGGRVCEVEEARCNAAMCQNGGACKDVGGSVTCDCEGTGFTGSTCGTDLDECASNPCQNGGTCTNTSGDYICKCRDLFSGKDCSIAPNLIIDDSCEGEGSSLRGNSCLGTSSQGTQSKKKSKALWVGLLCGSLLLILLVGASVMLYRAKKRASKEIDEPQKGRQIPQPVGDSGLLRTIHNGEVLASPKAPTPTPMGLRFVATTMHRMTR